MMFIEAKNFARPTVDATMAPDDVSALRFFGLYLEYF
jgi:hypothetical protein